MMVHFIRTVVVDYECYVDHCALQDGSEVTYVLEKTGEPNKFTEVESKQGDHVDQMVADYKYKRGDGNEIAYA